MGVVIPNQKIGQKKKVPIRLVAPWFIEYGFYASLIYGVMAPVLGIQIDRLGIVLLAALACFSFLGFRERPADFLKTLIFPISLGIAYLMIQLMYHGLTIQSDYVKPFIPWMFTLIVTQALTFRKGFFHRFTLFALFLGSATLFFLDIREGGDGVIRMGLEQEVGGLSNPNSLATWFGFCSVYFFVLGVTTTRQKVCITSWIIAMACLFVVTLTVSRGALLATILALILGGRNFLKRGFLPLLIFSVLAWVAYGVGLFDQAISYYTTRGTEETGRFLVWPRAFDEFLNAPLTGVGASDVYIFLPEKAKMATPHNGFLFIALASGIIPVILYAAYWFQAIWATVFPQNSGTEASAMYLPLVAYSFLTCLSSNMTFMEPWVVVTLTAVLTFSLPKGVGNSNTTRRSNISS